MAIYTTISDFENELALSSNTNSNNATLQSYINDFEPKILKKLLGYELYQVCLSEWGELVIQEPFKTLLNGGEYDFEYLGNTFKYNFEGITAITARYIYYKYVRNTQKVNTPLGMVNQNENGEKVSPVQKLSRVWNKMYSIYGNGDTYNHQNPNNSAYNYILKNKAEFEANATWIFTQIQTINPFGI